MNRYIDFAFCESSQSFIIRSFTRVRIIMINLIAWFVCMMFRNQKRRWGRVQNSFRPIDRPSQQNGEGGTINLGDFQMQKIKYSLLIDSSLFFSTVGSTCYTPKLQSVRNARTIILKNRIYEVTYSMRVAASCHLPRKGRGYSNNYVVITVKVSDKEIKNKKILRQHFRLSSGLASTS